jgi:hypothetical protein
VMLDSMQAKERHKQGSTLSGTKLAQRYRPELGINICSRWANETEGSEIPTPKDENPRIKTSGLTESIFLNPNTMATYDTPNLTANGSGRNSKDDTEMMTNILSIMQEDREEKTHNRRNRSHQLIKDGWIHLQQSLDRKIQRGADGHGELRSGKEMEEWVKTIRHDKELISNLERAVKPSNGLQTVKQINKEFVQGFFKNLPAKVGSITNRVAMPVSRLTSYNEKNVFKTAKKGKYSPWVSVGDEFQFPISNLPKSQSNTGDKFFMMHKVATPRVTCQQPRESLMKKKTSAFNQRKESDPRPYRDGDNPIRGGKIEESGLSKSTMVGKQVRRHDSLNFRQTGEDFEVVLTKVEDCLGGKPKKPTLDGLLGLSQLSSRLFAQLGEKNKKLAMHSRTSIYPMGGF